MKHIGNPRFLATLTALALCLGLLAGCGQDKVPADTAQSSDTSEKTETTSPNGGDGSQEETSSQSGMDTSSDGDGTPIDALPEELPEELTFCSGAGAWRTNLSLGADGSFTGQYSDWDSGGDPSQYPEGIYYICNFSGTFSDLRQLDETTYAMTLETLTAQETEGEEWTEDGTLYIGSAPYGLEGGTEFFLYAPESSTDVLTTESLQVAWPEWNLPETVPEGQLGCWMLYNADMDQGFFSYE